MRSIIIIMLFLGSTCCTAQSDLVSTACSDTLIKEVSTIKIIPDKWLGQDKAKHFTVSMLLTGASGWIMQHRFDNDPETSRPAGAAFAFSLGLVKEIYDCFKPGRHFSWKDIIADLLGVIAGGLLLVW